MQLDLQIRAEIGLFYEAWLVCDDQACGNRTRMMSVYGKRCLVQYCRGQMHPEVRPPPPRPSALTVGQYSDSKLYNQLLYYSTLFDIEKSRAHVVGTARFGASAVAILNVLTKAQTRSRRSRSRTRCRSRSWARW